MFFLSITTRSFQFWIKEWCASNYCFTTNLYHFSYFSSIIIIDCKETLYKIGKKITWKLYQKQLFFFFGFCNMRRYVRILCWFKVGPPPSSNKIFNQPFLRNSVSSSQGFRKYSFKTIDFIFSWIEFASRNYYLK